MTVLQNATITPVVYYLLGATVTVGVNSGVKLAHPARIHAVWTVIGYTPITLGQNFSLALQYF